MSQPKIAYPTATASREFVYTLFECLIEAIQDFDENDKPVLEGFRERLMKSQYAEKNSSSS